MTDVLPRETVTFTSDGTFRPADYPWCVDFRILAKGGDAANGDQPGAAGYVMIEMYDQKVERS